MVFMNFFFDFDLIVVSFLFFVGVVFFFFVGLVVVVFMWCVKGEYVWGKLLWMGWFYEIRCCIDWVGIFMIVGFMKNIGVSVFEEIWYVCLILWCDVSWCFVLWINIDFIFFNIVFEIVILCFYLC